MTRIEGLFGRNRPPQLERRAGRRFVTEAREDNDWDFRVISPSTPKHREPIHTGQPDVEKRQIRSGSRVLAHRKQLGYGVSFASKVLGEQIPNLALVLTNEDSTQGRHVGSTARQLARLVYRMLRYGHDYVHVGEQAYDRQVQIRRLAALSETATSLGYTLVRSIPAG